MTVSLRKMSPGHGCDYLLKSVVVGDGDRSRRAPLTRYYAEAGTPPGVWMGSGVTEFGDRRIVPGKVVTPQQLELLLVHGRDPLTADQLGRAYPTYPTVQQRIDAHVAQLDPALCSEERDLEVARIEQAEEKKGPKTAVSGFDLTFSVPKSVSVLWGLADAGTQALLVDAHHDAVAEVLAFFEREVAITRAGANARNGAVAQHEVAGVAAAAYDHWDSRSGDPQLHTHVVVSNKVRTVYDGKWRSLDSIPIHRSVVAISEHYNAVLADLLTQRFGLGWERRDRGTDRNQALEIVGVPEDLISEFSNRSHDIDVETDRLIAEYADTHGRRPSDRTIVELRATATISTRPEKELHSLADLTSGWRRRATNHVEGDSTDWARQLIATTPVRALTADDVALDLVRQVGAEVVAVVGEKRSTWRHWNLWAEASRQTMEWRFVTPRDREAVVGMVVDAATRASLRLTPPELALTPEPLRRADGSSRFRPQHAAVFTSADLLAAEDRLLARSADTAAPTVEPAAVDKAVTGDVLGHRLNDEQAQALRSVATSGRSLGLLVGPAGAGKTTAMRALHIAWTAEHGPESVVGLAPSAAAAQVLADDLDIDCDNTAKWLHEHDHGRAAFHAGQLVILDEATLAGTHTLDRITGLATDAGAKVLLVGDWAQLQSVDAGGAFAMLAAAHDDTPELTEVVRFTHEWEAAASLALRDGDASAISTYAHHERIHDGTTEQMTDAAYAAWKRDIDAGRSSILVTEASATVIKLNERARAERILAGDTEPGREVVLADGTRASTGDLIITRRNNRRLRSLRGGWVRNGDRWRITDVLPDGDVVAHRLDQTSGHRSAGTVILPADYVGEYVELGYAVTAHRAQGATVDTAHVVASGATTRENLYVSMTRGRDANTVYVSLDDPDDTHAPPQDGDVSGRTVLYGILQRTGVELSAHQMIEAEHDQWTSIAQLGAEYDTIAAAAQHNRWAALVRSCGLDIAVAEQVIAGDSFGPLTAELRRAEANGHDVDRLLPEFVAARGLGDAVDVGAVLISRIHHAAPQPRRIGRKRVTPRLIAGLIPIADGPMTDEMRQALDERQTLMEQRAQALADEALHDHQPWTTRLGTPPADAADAGTWVVDLRTVAAYRDRYSITDSRPLGPKPTTDAQRADRARARAALRRMETLTAANTDVRGGAEREAPALR